MKFNLLILVFIGFFMQVANAQSPQAIPFQAVIRGSNGVLIPNQNISIRISVRTGTLGGVVVYREKQSVTTNNLGLVMLNIGTGTVDTGTFSSINWGSGSKFVQLEVDLSGTGTSYVTMGTSQLLSVPYALYAANSGGSGSFTAPSVTRIPYAGINGLISDAHFTRDSASKETHIECTDDSSYLSAFSINNNNAFMGFIDPIAGYANLLIAGHGGEFGFAHNTVVAATIDGNHNVMHGFYGMTDSTEMLTTALDSNGNFASNTYYGLVGTQAYSAYFDVLYNNGVSLNSLTLDSVGVHWEYNDTNQYTFPLRDGKAGQVLSTNGSGVLNWTNPMLEKAIFTPSSGDNITSVWGSNIIKPSSGIAALTITLPSSPVDNETVYFTFTNTITAITFSGGTVIGAIPGISSVSSGSVKYWLTYDVTSSSWY